MQLTNNLRTHIVYVKNPDWKDTEQIQITSTQYKTIKEDLENLKTNDFYTITDVDTWKVLYDWQKKDIVRFKEKEQSSNENRYAVCYYWERHLITEWKYICDCEQKMWLSPIYVLFALEMIGIKREYAYNITKEDRRVLYIEIRKEDFTERLNEFIKKKHKIFQIELEKRRLEWLQK